MRHAVSSSTTGWTGSRSKLANRSNFEGVLVSTTLAPLSSPTFEFLTADSERQPSCWRTMEAHRYKATRNYDTSLSLLIASLQDQGGRRIHPRWTRSVPVAKKIGLRERELVHSMSRHARHVYCIDRVLDLRYRLAICHFDSGGDDSRHKPKPPPHRMNATCEHCLLPSLCFAEGTLTSGVSIFGLPLEKNSASCPAGWVRQGLDHVGPPPR